MVKTINTAKPREMEKTVKSKSGVKDSNKTDVFQLGAFKTRQITLKASKGKRLKSSSSSSSSTPPPVDLFVVSPTEGGTYPVVLFCHGWKMTNEWYSDVFDHVASHGNIVVAPQFYSKLWDISVSEEIMKANEVTRWMDPGLRSALKENSFNDIHPDLDEKLAVAGHSRGGKIAFALAAGETGNRFRYKKKTSPLTLKDSSIPRIRGVIGIDPVGGQSPQDQAEPRMLKYIPQSFNTTVPVAVIGTGLSNRPRIPGFPPLAPDGMNHSEFFNESKPPVWYFLAKEYGHFDMLNDNTFVNILRKVFAVSGKEGTMNLMRSTTGGIMAAFLRAYFGDEDDDLDDMVDDPSIAPIVLDPVLHVKK